jgi:putative ABC transport system permease protein
VLCAVGIALGIAVVLAIDVANESARRAFRASSEAVSGGATHFVLGGPGGVDENEYAGLRVEHGFRGLRPVVDGHVRIAGARFTLLGIDPLSGSAAWSGGGEDAMSLPLLSTDGAVMMLASTAEALGLGVPSDIAASIGGATHRLRLVATLDPPNDLQRHGLRNVVIADITTAQLVLGMVGKLSRVELTSGDPRRVEELIPNSLTLVSADNRNRSMEQMTRAFHLNLTALSLLALMIGAFLIYNTMTLTVIKRREQFAVLRTLGMTSAQLFTGVIAEALMLAAVGFAAGAAAGIWLAGALLHFVGGTINDLYFAVEVRAVVVEPASLAKAAALALIATVAAACLPAWEAMRTTPAFGAIRSNIESSARRMNTPMSVAGVSLWMGAGLLLLFSRDSIVSGFASLFFIIMGFALITPKAMLYLLSALEWSTRRRTGAIGRMALRGVRASLSRTQVAVTALAVAVSAVVGVSVMILSFRTAVDHWLGNLLRADIYIAQPETHKAAGIDSAVIAEVGAQPQVESLSTGRWVTLEGASGPTLLFAVDLDRPAFDGYRFLDGKGDDVWPPFSAGDAVIVSEPLAYRRGLGVGAAVTLPTKNGEKAFKVAGLFYDYGSDQGVVVMHRNTYDRHWDDPVVSSFALYLEEGADAEALVDRLNRDVLLGQALRVRSNRTIRERSLEIFDRTFAITDVLRLLALCIAAVGILSALTAIQLERAREFAVLRALGLSPAQLGVLVAAESGVMGLIAGLVACPLGLIMAWVLIHIINRRSFGWSMELAFQPEPWIAALILSVTAAVAAGLYPAIKMAAKLPASPLRYE